MPDAGVSTEGPNAGLTSIYQESAPILRRALETRSPTLSDMRRIAGQTVVEVKNKFSSQPEQLVEEVLDLSLGFLRLEQDTLVKEGIRPSIEQRELSARLQHTYSDLIVKASERNDPKLCATIYDVLKSWQNLKNQRVFSQGNLPILWRGVESQIAIMRSLKKAGYEVLLPDYTQDYPEDDENEVLQMDVKSGVDMIAQKNGTVLVIDAKGRIAHPAPSLEQTYETDPYFEPNKLVRDKIIKMKPKKVIRTKIFVPSDTRSFVALPTRWPEKTDNPQEIINNFGRLRPQHELALVDNLDRIDMYSQPINRNFA